MRDLRIAAIRKRLGAATPGPWKSQIETDQTSDDLYAAVSGPSGFFLAICGPVGLCGSEKDAEFIAHTPDDIAYLLERVEELEGDAQ